MALTAFTSFSMLVAVSVALSNGTETAPWQPAMAHDAQGPQPMTPRSRLRRPCSPWCRTRRRSPRPTMFP